MPSRQIRGESVRMVLLSVLTLDYLIQFTEPPHTSRPPLDLFPAPTGNNIRAKNYCKGFMCAQDARIGP